MNQIQTWFPYSFICSLILFSSTTAQAQLIPDNTLGAENSRITPNVQIQGAAGDRIEGGAQRGGNLFHSFSQFNVNNGQRVYFVNPNGVQNILTRVTGGQISNILGTLGVEGSANLFLLNPNGIVFGPNARLEMGGSFVASTASAIKFADDTFFSATTPQSTPLLTINVPVGLQFGTSPGRIGVQGSGHNLTYDPFTAGTIRFDVPGLQVNPGKTLALVGGDVVLEGGNLRAESGRIELGSVTSPSLVSLTENQSGFALGYSGVNNFGNIQLSQKASVDASGESGGSIQVQGRQLSVRDGSSILSITSGTQPGESFTVNATELVELIGESADGQYASSLYTESQSSGASGNLRINTGKLIATDGAYVSTYIVSSGNGGSLTVNAKDSVELIGVGLFRSGFYTGTSPGSSGDSGQLTVETGRLNIKNGGLVFASTSGQGNAGNININVKDEVAITGTQDGITSTISSSVASGATGDGGNINITSGSLSLNDNGLLIASTSGNGDAGSVSIQASGSVFLTNSGIYSFVAENAVGNGGSVKIQAGSFSLLRGSEVNTNTRSQGNAGKIAINARETIALDGRSDRIFSRVTSTVNSTGKGTAGDIEIVTGSLKVTNRAFISSSTAGIGDAGNISIDARDSISFDNISFADTVVTGVGKGGDIRIATGTLSLSGGSQLSANVQGQGNAGNITIDARDAINLDGITNIGISSIQSQILTGGIGKGGDIRIATGSLSVTNGAQLGANTDGKGNAGNITINARDTVTFEGTGRSTLAGRNELFLSSEAGSTVGRNGIGKGGDIRINARALFLRNSGQLNANSFGQGDAGNITIDVGDTISFDGVGNNGLFSGANTFATQGNGGDIQLATGTLSLTNGGRLSTFARRNSGKITINARDAININGVGSNGLSSGAFSFLLSGGSEGKGGDIAIATGSLSVTNGAQINASTSGRGNGGNITIDARDAIALSGTGSNGLSSGIFSIVESGAFGQGGNVRVTTGSLSLSNGAQINSGTAGQGDGGNIFVFADDTISIDSSFIQGAVFPGGVGQAGNIDIQTSGISLANGAAINSVLFRPFRGLPAAKGRGGNIRINASDSLILSGVNTSGESSGIFTLTDRETSGSAGSIAISTDKFAVRDGAIVSALTSNSDDGGNITINARTFEAIDGGQVSTNARSRGNAGTIQLNVTESVLLTGSDPNFTQRLEQVRQRLQQPGETDLLSDVVLNEGSSSGIFASTTAGSTGEGGSIFIDPPAVTIRDGAKISVNSDGTGDAGNIALQAGTLFLDNGATISAETDGSQGGDINLRLGQLLLLRRGSQISTNAGTDQAGGDGGNITINSPFIVSVARENNNISANAYRGKGGNIRISTQGLFGIAARQQSTSGSDITASSQLGVQGDIAIEQPEVQQNQEIVELPGQVLDASTEVAQTCSRRVGSRSLGEFFFTGRGSLPPNPLEPLAGTPDLISLATLDGEVSGDAGTRETRETKGHRDTGSVEIVEAQGWVKTADGKIALVAQAPEATPYAATTSAVCPVPD
ncbi:hypothetical protein NUACC21_24490 [Scytonema sp. NUACC21]